jgi:hypothetical protein
MYNALKHVFIGGLLIHLRVNVGHSIDADLRAVKSQIPR